MLTKIFHKNTTSSCELSNNLDYYLRVFNHFFYFLKNYKMKNLLIQLASIIVALVLAYYLIDFLANKI